MSMQTDRKHHVDNSQTAHAEKGIKDNRAYDLCFALLCTEFPGKYKVARFVHLNLRWVWLSLKDKWHLACQHLPYKSCT